MKSKLLFLSFLISAVLCISCGNKSKTTDASDDNKTETTEAVEKVAEKPAIEKVPMSIEVDNKEPCSGGSFILTIKGGVPFDDEKTLFKIESEFISNEFGSDKRSKVYPRKFVKKEGNVYKIEVSVEGGYNTKHKLIVTDAAGTQETIEFEMCYCA